MKIAVLGILITIAHSLKIDGESHEVKLPKWCKRDSHCPEGYKCDLSVKDREGKCIAK